MDGGLNTRGGGLRGPEGDSVCRFLTDAGVPRASRLACIWTLCQSGARLPDHRGPASTDPVDRRSQLWSGASPSFTKGMWKCTCHRSPTVEPSGTIVGDDRADREHGDTAGARLARRLRVRRLRTPRSWRSNSASTADAEERCIAWRAKWQSSQEPIGVAGGESPVGRYTGERGGTEENAPQAPRLAASRTRATNSLLAFVYPCWSYPYSSASRFFSAAYWAAISGWWRR